MTIPHSKRLLALALALLAANGAHAEGSVTISGFLDLSLEAVNTGKGTLKRQSTGQLNQSRLEFNGKEELGGGLTAFFILAMPFSPDVGTSSSNGTFSRTSLVGLRSQSLGTVKLGRQQSLSDETLASFWALRWGASTNYFLYYGNTTQLLSNAVRYESPNFGGFSFAALHALGEGSGNATEGRLTYAQDKLLINGAYYVSRGHEFVESGASVKIATLGASYDFGMITPSLVYQDTRTHEAVINKTNKSSLAVSATVPLGSNSLWLDYGVLRDHAKDDADARALSIRLDHYLSKRTFVYAGVAQVWNGSSSYYQPMGASGSYPVFTSPTGVSTGNGGATYNGHNSRSMLVGIRTSF